jgi:prepilin-type N-terminal cleavage/methylation domain-containing protein
LELTLTVARPYNVFSFIFTGHHHITKERNMKNQKGFTLVELMIVVAIIGILAAIAIPQFAAYRVRGFNSSALSDVRNLNTSEAAFFADWQMYGKTEQAAALPGAGGNGVGAAATIATAAPVSLPIITATTDAGGTVQGLQIPIGNGVTAVANTDVAGVNVALGNASFAAVSKHVNGDTFFAVDGDSTAIYQDNSSAVPATGVAYVLLPADVPVSAPTADSFIGVPGPSGGNWVAK